MKRFIGIVISVCLLAYVLSGVQWQELLVQMKRISAADLVILVALYLLGYPLRAWRSHLMLPSLSFREALGGVFVGYAANNVLPARLGELVRAKVMARKINEPTGVLLSSILMERVFDGLAVVTLLIVGARSLDLPDWALNVRSFGLALFGCLFAGIVLVGRTSRIWKDIAAKLPATQFLNALVDGATVATRTYLTIFSVMCLSVLIWVAESLMFYYGFHAFNLPGTLLNAFFILGVLNLGLLIPSSPGNVGVFQYFTVLALSVLLIPKAEATAYALVLHICQYVPVTVIGLWYTYRYGFRSMKELKSAVG